MLHIQGMDVNAQRTLVIVGAVLHLVVQYVQEMGYVNAAGAFAKLMGIKVITSHTKLTRVCKGVWVIEENTRNYNIIYSCNTVSYNHTRRIL